MPSVIFRPDLPGVLRTDADVWVQKGLGAGLRVNFDTGLLPSAGILTLPNWRVESLSELWAIRPFSQKLEESSRDDLWNAVVQERGALDCTISVDDGVTWLYWNGSAWAAAGASWTSFTVLNTHLAAIPFGAVRQLRLKIRLRKGGDAHGPVFEGVRIGYSVVPDSTTEDPHRTLRRLLEAQVRVFVRSTYDMPSAAATLDLQHPLEIDSVMAAYNLTTDPTRLVNIASGSTTTNANFTGAQALGNVIEIQWKAKVKVSLANKDADFNPETSPHIPALLIRIPNSEDAMKAKLSETFGHYTINIALSSYWNEHPPIPVDYRIHVFALAADEVLALKIINAAYRVLRDFSTREPLWMVLTGTEAEMVHFTPPFSNLTDTSENLSVKGFTFILCAREWLTETLTGPLAETFDIVLQDG